jgi:hypothetical protein
MLKWLKLSHYHHSGHFRPHEHTSYLPLCIILLVVGITLTTFTAYASSPGPEAQSISLTGTVPGKAPTIAATINAPTSGQHFSISPVTVSGSCPSDTLVEIYKNDIFAGSTSCTSAGIYTLQVDLLIGQNILTARVYDALNQAGPVSNAATVFYDALPAQSASLNLLNFGGAQLVINSDAVFRGVFPEQTLNVPITIIGGTAPYAVNIQWGDSTNKVIPRNDNVGFSSSHIYSQAGTFQITIQASDALGRVGFLSIAAIVNGQPPVAITTTTLANTITNNKLLALWPLYVSSVAVVLSFWLGERREKYILSKKPLPIPTQV